MQSSSLHVLRLQLLIVTLTFTFGLSYGQGSKVLPYFDYIGIVRSSHPISFRAALLQKSADAKVLTAKGGFDPKVMASLDEKNFQDKNYYTKVNGALKVPLWFGPDLNLSYENNDGAFLNQSDQVPDRGLWSGGLQLPIGKGLIIDERRTILRQANLYQVANIFEQRLLINKLIADASIAYFLWQESYQNYSVISNSINLARKRLAFSVKSYEQGANPAIDTLEVLIALQTRQMDSIEAKNDLDVKRQNLHYFLWVDGSIPLELQDNTVPEPFDMSLLAFQVDSIALQQEEIIKAHPAIRLYEYKGRDLSLQQRWNKEQLKPDVNLYYNPITATDQDLLFISPDLQDYKLAVGFSMPLFLRKERGKILETNAKMDDNILATHLKSMEINNKISNYIQSAKALNQQLVIAETNLVNYGTMLDAENRKFELGESSIFLINSREQKYIESQQKVISLRQKLSSYRVELIQSAAAF